MAFSSYKAREDERAQERKKNLGKGTERDEKKEAGKKAKKPKEGKEPQNQRTKAKKPGAKWTKGRKQRAKPSFGLVPEFKHNIQIKKNREKEEEKQGMDRVFREWPEKQKGIERRIGKRNKPEETRVETKKDT